MISSASNTAPAGSGHDTTSTPLPSPQPTSCVGRCRVVSTIQAVTVEAMDLLFNATAQSTRSAASQAPRISAGS
jgi:hypothetical protein